MESEERGEEFHGVNTFGRKITKTNKSKPNNEELQKENQNLKRQVDDLTQLLEVSKSRVRVMLIIDLGSDSHRIRFVPSYWSKNATRRR